MKCRHCGKEFEPQTRRQKFCSCNCSIKAHYYRSHERRPDKRPCDHCGKEYVPISISSRYCSANCAKLGKLEKARKRYANLHAERATQTAIAKAKVVIASDVNTEEKPQSKEKSLEDWIREASECNMDYGNYRAQIEHFGKTFEQLKAQADSKSGEHAHCRHRFIRY